MTKPDEKRTLDREAVEDFAAELERFAAAAARDAERLRSRGLDTSSSHRRGMADGYDMAARWLRRDVLGQPVPEEP